MVFIITLDILVSYTTVGLVAIDLAFKGLEINKVQPIIEIQILFVSSSKKKQYGNRKRKVCLLLCK